MCWAAAGTEALCSMWQGFSSSWEVRLKAAGGAGQAGKVQRGSGKRVEQRSVASRVHSAPSPLGSSTVCSRHLLTTILAVRDAKGNEIQSSVSRALGISVLRWKRDWGYDTYVTAVGDLRRRRICWAFYTSMSCIVVLNPGGVFSPKACAGP